MRGCCRRPKEGKIVLFYRVNELFYHLDDADATEHRNMPLESAISLVLNNYEQWLMDNGDPGRSAQASEPSQTGRHGPPSDFKRPDDNKVRMLQMAIDGRCLVVEELDEVIDYFQQQRNIMAKAQGITSKPLPPGQYIVYFVAAAYDTGTQNICYTYNILCTFPETSVCSLEPRIIVEICIWRRVERNIWVDEMINEELLRNIVGL